MAHIIGTRFSDDIDGTSSADTIEGRGGDDRIWGHGGDDLLIGGSGHDDLDGGSGADRMEGGTGDDLYVVDSVADQVVELAGEGIDVVLTYLTDYTLGANVEDLVALSASDFRGTGNGLDNYIYGYLGDDILDGGAGNDVMFGHEGDDSFFVDDAGDEVVEYSGEGHDTVFTSLASLTLAANVEDLIFDGSGAFAGFGNGLANYIESAAGNDLLDGRGGADELHGRGGDDTYVVDHRGDLVVEAAGEGNDIIFAEVSYVLASNQEVETLSTRLHSGTRVIDLTGNQLANSLYGNFADNFLNGGGGADLMVGFRGDDTYVVDNSGDRVVEGAGEGDDTVLAHVSYALSNGQEIETLSTASHRGTAAIDLFGNDLGNRLIGNFGDNHLNGRGGADVMTGLAGNDTYVIDNGGDRIVEAAGEGSDSALTFVSYALESGQEIELLSAAAHRDTAPIDLAGNGFAQTVHGNFGSNVLDGKGGSDVLTGLAGADRFAFTTALGANNIDRITDFEVGVDEIALDDSVFAGLAPGPLPAGAFRSGAAAQDADDRIIYNPETGALLFDPDGSGAAAAVQFATLQAGLTALSASDFTVI